MTLSGPPLHSPAAASRATPGSGARAPASLSGLSVLIVDDEPGMRNFMGRILGPQCSRIETAASTSEAADWLSVAKFDVIVLDNMLGHERGLDWLSRQRLRHEMPPVVLISAFADLEVAVEAMQAGAVDLILKPFRSAQLVTALQRVAGPAGRRAAQDPHPAPAARRAPALQGARPELTGSSPALQAVRAMIARVAPLPSSVLLTGASGTGKEVAARLIHAQSGRAGADFIAVNCAALSAEMADSELFGHVEGAFAGASAHRAGLFLQAHGGTLFLDEITGLSPDLQARLLRVIEDRRIRPLGGEQELPVDLRLIFATNADLAAEVAAGRFRADLYHRINILQLRMPTLAERAADIPALAQLFMAQLSRDLGLPPLAFTPELDRAMQARDWPGNVRELRNLVERALIHGSFAADFPEIAGGGDTGSDG